MKKYFGYIRVSTTKQGEQGSSLQEQKSAIEAYASRHGLRIVEWFEEQETAAAQGRPIFGRMLKEIERGAASGVITHKIDRSARNLKDWAHIGELIDRGVEMHFAHESLDLMSRSGRLSADILAVVASDYIRNLRDEVRKGFYGRLKQGLYPLGAPLGYLDQGGGKPKVIDPIRGPLVRRAFDLYRTGLWTLETLEEELHRCGLRNRRGGRVTHTGLSTILNSPFYIGIIKLKRSQQVFQGIHEPLIDPSTFNAVADVLAGRTPHWGTRRQHRYQLLLRCTLCGYSLSPEIQKGNTYYRCHTKTCPEASVRESHLDETLLSYARRLALTDAEWAYAKRDLEALLENMDDTHPRERERLQLHLAASEDRLKRTTDAYIDAAIDKASFDNRKAQLLHEQAGFRSEIGKIDGGGSSSEATARRIFELSKALSSLAKTPSDDELRQILSDTTSNLTVLRKNLTIEWQKPFDRLVSEASVTAGGPMRGEPRTGVIARLIFEHVKQKEGADPDLGP